MNAVTDVFSEKRVTLTKRANALHPAKGGHVEVMDVEVIF